MVIELLGMLAGGDAYFTRDEYGTTRRHDRFRPGPPVLISHDAAMQALALTGSSRLHLSFDTWQEVSTEAESRAPKVAFTGEVADLSEVIIRRSPRLLRDWLADSRRALVPLVVGRLLRTPVALEDGDLTKQLETLIEPRVAPPSIISPRTQSVNEFYGVAA